MATQWIARLYLFIPVASVDASLRDAVADAYADNSSGEMVANERKFIDNMIRLSASGTEPAQILAFNSAVKGAMGDTIRNIIQPVSQSAWYTVSNIDGLVVSEMTYNEGELIAFGGQAVASGRVRTVFAFTDTLADLGLQVIETEV